MKLGPITRRRSLAVAVVLGAFGLAASAGATGGGWVATHTRALHLAGQLLGRAPAGQVLRISVTLPLRNRAAINPLIESHTVLTPAQVRARFSPTTSSVAAVESYLRRNGFTHLSVAADRLLVTGDATAAGAERAFHTSLSIYRLKGKVVYANTTAAQVPAALHGDVAAVLGLSDVPIALPSVHASSGPDLTGFTPKAVANAYDDSKMKPATATTTAIVAAGDMTPIIANLRYAEQQWHYPAVPVHMSMALRRPRSSTTIRSPATWSGIWTPRSPRWCPRRSSSS